MSLFRVPAGKLTRARWILFIACLVNAIALVPVFLLATNASLWRTGAELLSLLVLVFWWRRGYRRGGFSIGSTLVAAVAIAVCSRLHTDRATILGVLYMSVGLSALYGPFGRVATGALLLAFGFSTSLVGQGVETWLLELRVLAGTPVVTLSLFMMAAMLKRLERAVALEDALAEVSAALVAAADRETLQQVAVDGCLSLMGHRASIRVSLWLGTRHDYSLVAVAGGTAPTPIGTKLNVGGILDQPLSSSSGSNFALQHEQLAKLQARLSSPIKSGEIRLSPLFAKGQLLGVLVVACDDVLPSESTRILGSYARQVALALESMRLKENLSASEARFRSIVQNTSDIVTLLDTEGVLKYVTPSAATLFGRPVEQVLGQPLVAFVVADEQERVRELLERSRSSGRESIQGEFRVLRPDGSTRGLETHFTNLLEDPSVRAFVLVNRDVTERKALETQLAHQAFHDPLTGLANRALFRDRLEHALARRARSRTPIAVMFIDLDDFKTVNDCLGHAAGDLTLVKTAERLQSCLRGTDTAARLGGDEFAVLLEDPRQVEDVTVVAERILAALCAPMQIQDRDVVISASVGIAFSANSEEGVEDLLSSADLAMYQAKQRGKNCYEVSDPDVRARVLKRLETEADLRRAVDANEFSVVYLPTVALATGQIVGVEALLRWNHPRRGVVLPSDFIPAAEATGTIHPLGRWILVEACTQGRRWSEEYPQLPLTVSVNLSLRQIQRAGFVDDVAAVLSRTGFDPHRLVLELTESVVLDDAEATLERLHTLKALGVRLAIDDFGTGYSSLSSLPKLPIDYIKIDKPFVDTVGGLQNSALAFAITTLGQIFHLEVVAEGIERAEQVGGLRALGCEQGQGYYFSPPVTADEVSKLLAEPRLGAARHLSSLPGRRMRLA